MAAERSAVLLDWGGVLTTDLFASFAAFCAEEGLDRASWRPLPPRPRRAGAAHRLRVRAHRGGRLRAAPGRRRSAWRSTTASSTACSPARGRRGHDRRRARAHERGVRTGLVSNSWGTRRYPRELLAELFDGIVISGEEGMRKPDPRMYELGAERIGLPAERVRLRRRPGVQPRAGARARHGDGAPHVGGYDGGGARAAAGLARGSCRGAGACAERRLPPQRG